MGEGWFVSRVVKELAKNGFSNSVIHVIAYIIHQFKENSSQPVAAYQVSGEYAMIQAAIEAGYLDKEKAIEESLTSIKRAGADIILSYFAKEYLLNIK